MGAHAYKPTDRVPWEGARSVVRPHRMRSVGFENITASESQIRDADFAQETAALTRAQILTQAGTSVLATANTTSQSVLRLLQ